MAKGNAHMNAPNWLWFLVAILVCLGIIFLFTQLFEFKG